MRRTTVLLVLLSLVILEAAPASALPRGYEAVPFGDGAVCNFTGEEALYGTPGYPDEDLETVLLKAREHVDGQGRLHQSVDVIFDGVRYELREGEGPAAFLAYGTLKARAWLEFDEAGEEIVTAKVSLVWNWTLTDPAGAFLGTSHGNIVDFGVDEGEPRLVHNSSGVCSEP